eukprot:TRINITY_DN318_c0_g1_i1.p1 TRINITY_DN318_c0_g1~~TRINITY_DN318_c0_g1_i1.p1  ORF type:complete len:303 (-),score=23.97 TRINITY_DN318_c0_g1_i1:413-1321(-)
MDMPIPLRLFGACYWFTLEYSLFTLLMLWCHNLASPIFHCSHSPSPNPGHASRGDTHHIPVGTMCTDSLSLSPSFSISLSLSFRYIIVTRQLKTCAPSASRIIWQPRASNPAAPLPLCVRVLGPVSLPSLSLSLSLSPSVPLYLSICMTRISQYNSTLCIPPSPLIDTAPQTQAIAVEISKPAESSPPIAIPARPAPNTTLVADPNGRSPAASSSLGSSLPGSFSPGTDLALSTSPQKNTSRCWSCKKRIGLTGFRCRCGFYYCGTHRYSDKHSCTFDYKAEARKELSKANPVVKASKLEKI